MSATVPSRSAAEPHPRPAATHLDTPAARVLRCFSAPGATLSGEDMARQLGLSRTAVWKQIRALRGMGYRIASLGRRGYRLDAAATTPIATEVLPRLQTRLLGRELHYLPLTASTNNDLTKLAAAGAPEGTVVAAESQSAGRGRLTRTWFSPAGAGLYFSLLLRPSIEPAQATSLPLIVGLAVAQALEASVPDLRVALKWPNDLFVADKKIAGILCELQAEADRIHHIVVGIGINTRLTARALPPELRDVATSMAIAGGRDINHAVLLAGILNALETDYLAWTRHGLAPFLPAIRARDALFGREIAVACAGGVLHGHADGVALDGALRLRRADGSITPVYSGDARLLRH